MICKIRTNSYKSWQKFFVPVKNGRALNLPLLLPLAAIITWLTASCANPQPAVAVLGATHTPPPPQVTIIQQTTVPALLTLPPAATASLLPTATPNPECALFDVNVDLLLPVVNRNSGLASDFEPPDLETPALAFRNAYIVPIRVRKVVLQPLYDLLAAANEAGLHVIAASAYRSYQEQAVAYETWKRRYPDRAETFSAAPGHSEHQLGTVVDFSTSFMQADYGEVFHTDFFKLAEGRWLYDYSPQYGFTLSYPAWAEQVTGYQWEPWHFRYVGVALAQYLFEKKMTLTEYLGRCAPI